MLLCNPIQSSWLVVLIADTDTRVASGITGTLRLRALTLPARTSSATHCCTQGCRRKRSWRLASTTGCTEWDCGSAEELARPPSQRLGTGQCCYAESILHRFLLVSWTNRSRSAANAVFLPNETKFQPSTTRRRYTAENAVSCVHLCSSERVSSVLQLRFCSVLGSLGFPFSFIVFVWIGNV